MKKLIFLFLLFIISGYTAQAQRNQGGSGMSTLAYWEIVRDAVPVSDLAEDFDFYATIEGTTDTIDQNGEGNEVFNVGGSCLIQLDYQTFKGPLDESKTIIIVLKQKSTNLVVVKKIEPPLNLDGVVEYYGADGIDLGNGTAPAVISISVDGATLCENSTEQKTVTATVEGTTDYTITWPAGITQDQANKNKGIISDKTKFAVGDNTVTATLNDNVSGEKKTANFTVTITPTPAAPQLSELTPQCPGSDFTLQVTNAGSDYTSEATFVWSPAPKSGQGTVSATFTMPDADTDYTVKVTDGGCDNQTTKTVSKRRLTVTLTASPTTITLGESVTLTAGGEDGLSFTFKDPIAGQTSPATHTPTATGEITYTVTGSKDGCSADATVKVAVNPAGPPVVAATGGQACSGKTVAVTSEVTSGGTPNFTYAWTSDEPKITFTDAGAQNTTVNVAKDLAAGTYKATVTVTDAANKSTSKDVDIIVTNLNVTLNVAPNPVVIGNEVTLTAGGEAGANYTWDAPAVQGATNNVATHTPTTAGTQKYKVTGVKEGCYGWKETTVTVNEPGAPTVDAIAGGVGVDGVAESECAGRSLAVTSSASGGKGQLSYRWSASDANLTFDDANAQNTNVNIPSNMLAGDYTITMTVTDENSKTGTKSFTLHVTRLNVTLVADKSTITLGEEVTLTAGGPAGTQYTWASPATEVPANNNKATHTPTANGSQKYAVTGVNDNCYGNAEITVQVNEADAPVIDEENSGIGTGVDGVAGTECSGRELAVTSAAKGGKPEYDYEWTAKDSRLTFVDPLSQNTSVKIPKDLPAGTYILTVTVRDANGKTGSKSFSLHVTNLNVTLAADPTTVKAGEEVALTAGGETNSTYTWEAPAVVDATYNYKATHTPTTPGTQKYKVNGEKNGCYGWAETQVMVTNPGAPVITLTDATACAGTAVSLEPTIAGGVEPFNYTWTTNQPKLQFTTPGEKNTVVTITDDLAAGSYPVTLTVTDGSGKTGAKTVMITVTRLNVTITPSKNPITLGETVTLTAGGATNYTWGAPLGGTGASKTDKPTTVGTKNYSVIGKDATGCTGNADVDVIVDEAIPDELIVTATGGEKCAGGAIQVTSNVTGGTKPYKKYAWTSLSPKLTFNGATDGTTAMVNIASDATAGVYEVQVEVTDKNDERAIGKAQITVREQIILVSSQSVCTSLTTFDAEIEVAGGNGGTYKVYTNSTATTEEASAVWETGTKVKIPDLTAAKTFYIKETPDGCNALPVAVRKPDCTCGAQLLVEVSEKTCANSGNPITINLKASGGTAYSFDVVDKLGAKVLSVVNEASQSEWSIPVDANHEGTYRIVGFKAVTDMSPDGCDGNVSRTEIDIRFHGVPIVNAGQDIKSCGNDPVKLTATGTGSQGIELTWDKGVQNGVEFVPPMNGTTTYTVTATDINNCQSTDEVTVTVDPKPTVFASVTPAEVCQGNSVVLTANGSATKFEWNNGGNNDGTPIIPQVSTRYTVTGTDVATGCFDTASVDVKVKLLPQIVSYKPESGVKNIAIGHTGQLSVEAIGENLKYQWQQSVDGGTTWLDMADNSAVPQISGARTNTISLSEVPRAWDGYMLKCVVTNECGTAAQEFTLKVSECFPIEIEMFFQEGITRDETGGNNIDGWYCRGSRVSLKAVITNEDGMPIEDPHFKWKSDGQDFKVEHPGVTTDTAVLSWIPGEWEDDVTISVCGYSDGACEEVCSHYFRLKARQYEDASVAIATSIDPSRAFCPGDTIDFTVAVKKGGLNPKFHWYNDIFDLESQRPVNNELIHLDGKDMILSMGQENTWVRVVLEPSPEICVQGIISDSIYLKKKEYVHPSLQIVNNIGDTIACRGDKIGFSAIFENAGANPTFQWYNDIWNLGTGQFAEAELNDKDMWIRCNLYPGDDVCYDGSMITDTMVIRVVENGSVTITADMKDKMPGDELTFYSSVENMMGNVIYHWYVNNGQMDWSEKDYVSDMLRQGDVVMCGVSGEHVCQKQVFSNEIVVNFGLHSRDTMVYLYQGEEIKKMDLFLPGDEDYHFIIVENAMNGHAVMTANGIFSYKPNAGFVGVDYVKYIVRSKYDKDKFEEGYVYITVDENGLEKLPNIITPNGDGMNDEWHLEMITENYPDDYIISVYNRVGKIVFQCRNNYQNDWNGQGGNNTYYMPYTNLPSGIYTYVIELNRGQKKLISWLEIRSELNRKGYR